MVSFGAAGKYNHHCNLRNPKGSHFPCPPQSPRSLALIPYPCLCRGRISLWEFVFLVIVYGQGREIVQRWSDLRNVNTHSPFRVSMDHRRLLGHRICPFPLYGFIHKRYNLPAPWQDLGRTLAGLWQDLARVCLAGSATPHFPKHLPVRHPASCARSCVSYWSGGAGRLTV